MAYSLVCQLSDRGSQGYGVRLSLPDGQLFERLLADADLANLRSRAFEFPAAQANVVGTEYFKLLFTGAEPLLDETIARAAGEPDRLARVLLEVADRNLAYLPWELAMLGNAGGTGFEIVRTVPVAPQLAGRVPKLPFRVMVANMGAPHEDTRTFPLRTVLLNIFVHPERLTKVFHPTTLAGVDCDELVGVLAHSRYEIVHLQVLTQWDYDSPGPSPAMIAAPGDGPPLVSRTLLPLLQSAQTRLLILQLRQPPYAAPQAAQLFDLAQDIVEGGGPAVLIVPFDIPSLSGGTVMLNRVYDLIVHDRPLDAALHTARIDALYSDQARSDPSIAMRPSLIVGQGGENLLRVSPLAVDLLERTSEVRNQAFHLSWKIDRLASQSSLDLSGTRNILGRVDGMFDQAQRIASAIEDWWSESRGLMPLHEAAEIAGGGRRELEGVESAIARFEEASARVVNLCFLRDKNPVAGQEALLRDAGYELRLQIGKPWLYNTIVRDAQPLPDQYLDEHSDETGIGLDVCLYTEDFSLPEGSIFSLRLPRAPAPSKDLDIAVRTPRKLGRARLRVCLYYRQNLVQSLMVVARVAASATKPRQGSNYANFEFSMADTILGVEQLPPRILNLLTNDSDNGTHKIAIRGSDIKLQYTLTGSSAIGEIRKTLMTICAEVGQDGKPTRYNYSDSDNSGDEPKLIADLKELAAIGGRLYTDLITDPANWDEQDPLEQKLKQPGEIQISITSSARNVYPWALVYDRKLESGPGIDVCPIILKKLTGVQPGSSLYTGSCVDEACPHARDVKMICPLGFWGFRHAVEQLPPNQGQVVDTITAHRPPSFIMAVHQSLAGKIHRAEVEKDTDITANYCDLKSAISTALKSAKPHVVYFYCHGGRTSKSPWLGIGKGEQIEPGDFRAWDTRWRETTPLVVVNGCHTVDLNPDDLLDFVKVFAWCRAAGVVGTEIAIPESLGREFGRFFVSRFAKGQNVATIFRDFRLSLLAKRNLLGLAYTSYCHGDLHLVLN